MQAPECREKIYSCFFLVYFRDCILAPAITLPVMERVPVKGPLIGILISLLVGGSAFSGGCNTLDNHTIK
jgi:hypothetical protein